MIDEITQLTVGLLKMTEAHMVNQVRFTCVFCGWTQGEYDKGEEGYLYAGVCKQCNPHTWEYLKKAANERPQAMVELLRHYRQTLAELPKIFRETLK